MIDISPSKVVQIIFLARERGKADTELVGFIDNLNDDEKAHLTAIAWVGRGSYDPGDYVSALNHAYTEATVPTSTYLLGMPHLPENLEAGLDAMGVDVTWEEEDFL